MRNMGKTERRYRFYLTFFMLAEAWFAPGGWRLAFLAVAGYFALTAWARFCPLWWLLRIDTRDYNTLEVLPTRFIPPKTVRPFENRKRDNDKNHWRKSA